VGGGEGRGGEGKGGVEFVHGPNLVVLRGIFIPMENFFYRAM
jgi:hypothetical protein